jgi:RND family efflux transporter MFP subunit
MKSYKFILTYLLFSVLFLIVSCKGQKNKQMYGGGPVQVVPCTVQTGNVVYYDSYPATFVPLNEVQIRSEVTGYITGIFFTEGTMVTKGSKLYEIDRKKYTAAYDGAKANVEIARSNLQKAERDAERYKKLDEHNAIAKQTLDDALTALENSRMQLKNTNAAFSNVESDYNYSLITAPFSGSIGFSQVKPGAFVTSGQTLLNTISADDPMGVDFITDEKSLSYFLRLQKNKAAVSDSTFRIELPDNSEYKYSGKLDIIDRSVDPQTGTIKIRIVFPNSDRTLRPGMNCKLKVLNESSGEQLTIPSRSMVEQMGEYFVFLIENNVVKQRRIIPGPMLGSTLIVKSGLNAGDNIVLDGNQKVHDGSLVSINDTHGENKKISPGKGIN